MFFLLKAVLTSAHDEHINHYMVLLMHRVRFVLTVLRENFVKSTFQKPGRHRPLISYCRPLWQAKQLNLHVSCAVSEPSGP